MKITKHNYFTVTVPVLQEDGGTYIDMFTITMSSWQTNQHVAFVQRKVYSLYSGKCGQLDLYLDIWGV